MPKRKSINFALSFRYKSVMTATQKDQILQEIRQLIAGTDFENHVFMVGGIVRDELMGLPVKDIDICVDIPDGGIKLALFITHQQNTYRKRSHPELFQAYGIARFHLASFPDIELECVQTRQERYENRDSRNPVTGFAPIQDDCFRRDLTINALYKNISTGEIVDITGHGLSDLKQHIIRTPREPFITFDEDGLRLLRVVRFASRFGWKIEPDTLQGLKDCAPRIQTITQDRITDEISRMLCDPNPDYAMQLLSDTGLLPLVLPEWNEIAGNGTSWTNLLKAVAHADGLLEMRLTAFLQLFTWEESQAILKRMNFTLDIQKKVQKLHQHLHDLDGTDDENLLSDKELRKLQYAWGIEAESILNLLEGRFTSLNPGNEALIQSIKARCLQMKQEGTDCFALVLPVNGKDIMEALQLKPGPQIREFMNRALSMCFENPKITKQEILQKLNTEHC